MSIFGECIFKVAETTIIADRCLWDKGGGGGVGMGGRERRREEQKRTMGQKRTTGQKFTANSSKPLQFPGLIFVPSACDKRRREDGTLVAFKFSSLRSLRSVIYRGLQCLCNRG